MTPAQEARLDYASLISFAFAAALVLAFALVILL